MTVIRPAGITLERALEIAIECDRRNPFARRPGVEKLPQGRRLTFEDRNVILSSSDTAAQIGTLLGVSARTVLRVRERAAQDGVWAADQKRRQYLESFRWMTEEWVEIR